MTRVWTTGPPWRRPRLSRRTYSAGSRPRSKVNWVAGCQVVTFGQPGCRETCTRGQVDSERGCPDGAQRGVPRYRATARFDPVIGETIRARPRSGGDGGVLPRRGEATLVSSDLAAERGSTRAGDARPSGQRAEGDWQGGKHCGSRGGPAGLAGVSRRRRSASRSVNRAGHWPLGPRLGPQVPCPQPCCCPDRRAAGLDH